MAAPPSGANPNLLGGTAIKPVERHGLEAAKWFFWDPHRRAIMGRTPKSWALITVFYLIYYTCLAAFWALMMFIFFQTITYEQPKWMGEDGLIGRSPGLGLRPAQPKKTLDSSLILFNREAKVSSEHVPGTGLWHKQVASFLNIYKNSKLEACRDGKPHANGRPCKFDEAELDKCGIAKGNASSFGYAEGQPCVYLKLNKLFNVTNDHYTAADLPEDMPADLQANIRKQPVQMQQQVWVSCSGEYPADREAIARFDYFPKTRGFPSYYFPYTYTPVQAEKDFPNSEGDHKNRRYVSPVVAVKVIPATRPKGRPNAPDSTGQLLHVECRAWAKNIVYNRQDRLGLVRFELMVLNNDMAEQYIEAPEEDPEES